MARTMFKLEIFESNPASWVVPVPDLAILRGVVVDTLDPDKFNLWFEGDKEFLPNLTLFQIVRADERLAPGTVLVGSDLPSGRHVFRSPYVPKCQCNCATNGQCGHDWNGLYALVGDTIEPTCSNCGALYSTHPFPGKINPKIPRLRPKSPHQKEDCAACPNPSSKEVVLGKAQIRCCGNPDCVGQVIELAQKLAN